MKHQLSHAAIAVAVFCLPIFNLTAQAAEAVPADASIANPMAAVSQPRVQDIYLLIGQSNMAGRAAIEKLDQETLQNASLFNDKNQWEGATNLTVGMNRYSTTKKNTWLQTLNPAYTFGRKLAGYTGREIGLVCNARGGTKIVWWQKGYAGPKDDDLYEEAIIRTKAALAASPGATLKGIIWHQGESDNDKADAAVYGERLQKLVADLRTDLNAPEVPFVAGEVGSWNGRGQEVNPVIDQISQLIPHSGFASSQGLESRNLPKNDSHFDTLSQRVLGERYADVILQMVYGISPGGATLFSQPNFTGRSVELRPGKYQAVDLEKRGLLISELASIKLQKGYKVVLYAETAGTKDVTVSEELRNIADLDLASKIQSVEVVNQG